MTVSPPRHARRRRLVAATALAGALTLGGGYVAASALAPIPAPTIELAGEADQSFTVDPGATQAVVDRYQAPTAVGWLDGDEVWSNDDAAHPLASITKLVTALVVQEQRPLAPREPGAEYTWTAADVDFQAELAELDGIAFPIPEGTVVTQRQMLTLALIPSANDFATAYAHSVFGSTESFAAAARDWITRNGLTTIEVHEPSGMDDRNVGSAADVLRLARLALADPAIAEIVGTQRATLPWGIGEVESTNPLLGSMQHALGVKTGHTEAAGYSLAAGAGGSYADRELTRIAVVMGRDSGDQRADDARSILTAMAELPERAAVASAGEPLGRLIAVDGQAVELAVGDSADAVLVPGEEATRTFNAADETLTVAGPEGTTELTITRHGSITEPSLGWRLAHPRELFGFAPDARS